MQLEKDESCCPPGPNPSPDRGRNRRQHATEARLSRAGLLPPQLRNGRLTGEIERARLFGFAIMDPEFRKKIVRLIVTERLRRFYAELQARCRDTENFLARFDALNSKGKTRHRRNT